MLDDTFVGEHVIATANNDFLLLGIRCDCAFLVKSIIILACSVLVLFHSAKTRLI